MIKIKMIKAQLLLGFFILLGFNGCSRSPNEIDLLGQTMGTTYSIKIVSEENIEEEKIQHDIDSILVSINKQMST